MSVLKNAQAASGHWDFSPYTTALALAAIELTTSVTVPADPSKGSVTGKLVSGESGAPILGAVITVADNPAVTVGISEDGSFVISNLEPDNYQITYSAPGHLSAVQTVSLQQGQLANVGRVGLTIAPTTALISGQISEAFSNLPIADAEVTIAVADSTYITSSDAQGNYQQTVAEGLATLSINSSQHYPVTAHAQLAAGTHTRFSPSLTLLSEDQPTGSGVIGKVINAETSTGVEGVTVMSLDGESALTGVDGRFELTGIAAGEVVLQFSKNHYESKTVSAVIPENVTGNLGNIPLQEIVEQPSTTVSGRVTGLASGDPVPGASVVIGPHATQTDANGYYSISGINVLEFEVSVTATGYLFSNRLITLSSHTRVTADINLRRADIGGVAVKAAITDKTTYGSYEPVVISAEVENETAIEQKIRLYAKVIDTANTIVVSFPAVELPQLGDDPSSEELQHFESHLAEATETLTPNQKRLVVFEKWWNVGQITPGQYTVIVQVVDAATSQLMSELSTQITVAPTEDIASLHIIASPEYVLLNSHADIEMRIASFNRSNVPVTTELHYRLKQPDGIVMNEGTITLNLTPSQVNHQVVLGTLTHTFVKSGTYTVEVDVVSGAQPGLIRTGEIFVPPSTRLDVRQSLAPYEVAPVEGANVKINIEVEGVDSE